MDYPFLPHTEEEIGQMLESIGLKQIDDLYSDVPVLLKEELSIAPSKSEMRVCGWADCLPRAARAVANSLFQAPVRRCRTPGGKSHTQDLFSITRRPKKFARTRHLRGNDLTMTENKVARPRSANA